MFCSRDSQNWFFDVFSIRVFETLPAELPELDGVAVLPGKPLVIWLFAAMVPLMLREIFT